MKDWMETTDLKSSRVNYKTNWLRFRADRSTTPDRVWVFTDGSTTGWHAASLVVPNQFTRSVARFYEFHATRNIAAELNGLLLGLEIAPEKSTLSIVHDFIGCGAWTIGAWEIKSDAVLERITKARKLVEDKKLDVSFIHHAGHQNKKKKDRPICHSDFTKWNCTCDRMCEEQVVVDVTTPWSQQ
jgi:hypothetical protein